MGQFNVNRRALRMNEQHVVARTALRTLDAPWIRSPLRVMEVWDPDERTTAEKAGGFAARLAGRIFNTQGHRLRQAAQDRAYREKMRQHYSDSPEALAHMEPHFKAMSMQGAKRATHGRVERFMKGADAENPFMQHEPQAQTSTSHSAPASAHVVPQPTVHAGTPGASAAKPKDTSTPYDKPTPGETPAQAKERMQNYFAFKKHGTAVPPQPQKETPAPAGFSNTAQGAAAKPPAAPSGFSDTAHGAAAAAKPPAAKPGTPPAKPAPAVKATPKPAAPPAKPAAPAPVMNRDAKGNIIPPRANKDPSTISIINRAKKPAAPAARPSPAAVPAAPPEHVPLEKGGLGAPAPKPAAKPASAPANAKAAPAKGQVRNPALKPGMPVKVRAKVMPNQNVQGKGNRLQAIRTIQKIKGK